MFDNLALIKIEKLFFNYGPIIIMCQLNLNCLSITVFILEISFLMACQTESRKSNVN